MMTKNSIQKEVERLQRADGVVWRQTTLLDHVSLAQRLFDYFEKVDKLQEDLQLLRIKLSGANR